MKQFLFSVALLGYSFSAGNALAQPEQGAGKATAAGVAQLLLNQFAIADLNGDHALTFLEAVDVAPGLTQELFRELDVNKDGKVTQAELQLVSRLPIFGCSQTGPLATLGGFFANLILIPFAILLAFFGIAKQGQDENFG